MKPILSLLLFSSISSVLCHAATIAHWKFDDLTDISGNGHDLTNTNPTTTLSGGQAIFTGGGVGTAGQQIMSAPDNAVWSDTSFTVESIFTFTAPSTANISTLVAHMSTAGGRQWLVGTTMSNNAPYVILRNDTGGEASFVSNFGALTSGHTYYLAAAIDLTIATSANRITFYLRDLTVDGPFLTSNVSTSFTSLVASTAPLTIGSTGHSSSRFTGSIDEVRISDVKLGPNELLIAPIPEPSQALLCVVGAGLLGIRRKRSAIC